MRPLHNDELYRQDKKKTRKSHSLTSGFLKFGMKMLLRRGRAMIAVEKPKRAFSCKFLL
jgi:hypothetical protein